MSVKKGHCWHERILPQELVQGFDQEIAAVVMARIASSKMETEEFYKFRKIVFIFLQTQKLTLTKWSICLVQLLVHYLCWFHVWVNFHSQRKSIFIYHCEEVWRSLLAMFALFFFYRKGPLSWILDIIHENWILFHLVANQITSLFPSYRTYATFWLPSTLFLMISVFLFLMRLLCMCI